MSSPVKKLGYHSRSRFSATKDVISDEKAGIPIKMGGLPRLKIGSPMKIGIPIKVGGLPRLKMSSPVKKVGYHLKMGFSATKDVISGGKANQDGGFPRLKMLTHLCAESSTLACVGSVNMSVILKPPPR
jgi:hypothetical protein